MATQVMNGPTKTKDSKMDDVREQLYATFNEALEKTKQEVKQMQEKLKEYDDKFKATETVQAQTNKASEYIHTTLEEIRISLEKLAVRAKTTLVDAKEFSNSQLTELWGLLQENINKLRELAVKFDKDHHLTEKISEFVDPIVTQFNTVAEKLSKLPSVGRSFIIDTVANLENKYNIENKLTEIDEKYKIVDTAKKYAEKSNEFLAKQQVFEKLEELDEKLTGSKATGYVKKGIEIVSGEMERVQKEYESAKTK